MLSGHAAGKALLGVALIAMSGATSHAQRIAADGSGPVSGVVLNSNDGNLYGLTYYGGAYNNGVLYKINPNGSSYTVLHSFVGDVNEGSNPVGTLFVGADHNIYGVTANGGHYNYGTVFEYTSGGTFSTLHSFAGAEGAHPMGITGDSSTTPTLYGVTYHGGTGPGTLFKTTSTGTTTALYQFAETDGGEPDSAPIIDGNYLYGTTSSGGVNTDGTVYKYDLTASTLTTLWNFGGSDGNSSRSTFFRDGTTLYGTTRYGGNGVGNVFKIDENGGITVLGTCVQASTPWYLDNNVLESSTFSTDHALFGTANGNASNTMGCVYSLAGGTFTVKHNFTGAPSDGNGPTGILIRIGSADYGVTVAGGTYNTGTIYKVNEDGTGFQILHSFDQYVQFDRGFTGSGTVAAPTVSLTTSVPNELVIANVSIKSATTTASTLTNVSSGGNSYPWRLASSTVYSAQTLRQEIWYVVVPAPITSAQTITVTPGASALTAVTMDEYIGASIPNPIDVTPAGTTSNSTSLTNSITTSTGNTSYIAGYVAFAAAYQSNNSFTPQAGYTLTSGYVTGTPGVPLIAAEGEYKDTLITGGTAVTVTGTLGSTHPAVTTAVPIRSQAPPAP